MYDATWQIHSTNQQLPRTGDDDIASSSDQVLEVSEAKPSNVCHDNIASSDQFMEVSKVKPSEIYDDEPSSDQVMEASKPMPSKTGVNSHSLSIMPLFANQIFIIVLVIFALCPALVFYTDFFLF